MSREIKFGGITSRFDNVNESDSEDEKEYGIYVNHAGQSYGDRRAREREKQYQEEERLNNERIQQKFINQQKDIYAITTAEPVQDDNKTERKLSNPSEFSHEHLLELIKLNEKRRIQELLAEPNMRLNVNHVNENGWTALHFCAWNDSYLSFEALVQVDRVNVNSVTKTGASALHFAASRGSVMVAQQLSNHVNIDINLKNKNGFSPIHFACGKNNTVILAVLLSHPDIDIVAKTSSGDTARDIANRLKYQECVKMIDDARDKQKLRAKRNPSSKHGILLNGTQGFRRNQKANSLYNHETF